MKIFVQSERRSRNAPFRRFLYQHNGSRVPWLTSPRLGNVHFLDHIHSSRFSLAFLRVEYFEPIELGFVPFHNRGQATQSCVPSDHSTTALAALSPCGAARVLSL